MEAAGLELIPLAAHADLGTLDETVLQGKLRFAFVREPLSWYSSWWRHRHTFGDWNDAEPLDPMGRAPFAEFLNEVMSKFPQGFLSSFFERFTGPPSGEIEFVGRYEQLVDDLVVALNLAGERFDEVAIRSLPPVNVSSPLMKPSCPQEIVARVQQTELAAYRRFYPERLT
jgi:hypothetical protein